MNTEGLPVPSTPNRTLVSIRMASTEISSTTIKLALEAKTEPKKEDEEVQQETCEMDDDEEECYCGGPAEWCSENCKKSDIDEVFLKVKGRLPTSLEIFDDLFARWSEANAKKKLRGDAECECKKSYCTSCVRRE
jgi:hypothetical protein